MLIRLIGRFISRKIAGPRASRRKRQSQKEKREDKKPGAAQAQARIFPGRTFRDRKLVQPSKPPGFPHHRHSSAAVSSEDVATQVPDTFSPNQQLGDGTFVGRVAFAIYGSLRSELREGPIPEGTKGTPFRHTLSIVIACTVSYSRRCSERSPPRCSKVVPTSLNFWSRVAARWSLNSH